MSSTIAVIGAGAMGSAIVSGFVKSGAVEPSDISVIDHNAPKVDALVDGLGVWGGREAQELVGRTYDMVILAIKPQVMLEFIQDNANLFNGKLVVSIAAGLTLDTLEDALPNSRVIRVMPNLPVEICLGACAISAGPSAEPHDIRLVADLFNHLGCARVMTEAQLDIEAAVVGCAPAFYALFIDALTRSGVKAGLKASDARDLALITMQGTAAQLLDAHEHPRAYMDAVTSPGGTTAEALYRMEPYVMEGVFKGIEGALQRTKDLS